MISRKSRFCTGGFTLVEVIVAIILLAVGLLALASTQAVMTQMIAKGRQYTRVATVAASQLELLRSECGSATSGGRTDRTMRLSWTVEPRTGYREVVLIASWSGPGFSRADTFVTALPCD